MVDAKNNILLYDTTARKLIYKERLHESVAIDTRLANPLFLNDLIIYPTLDGRLLVMNMYQKRVLRDIAISDDDIFNNVIFLGVHNDVLIASTRSKVISVTTDAIKTFKVGVKDIIYDMDKVYIFTKDGKVILLTNSLQKLNELNLPYAIFSAVFAGDSKIYAVEKTGYLIEIEKDLSSYKVKKLSGKIESPVIGFNGKVYIGDKYIILK
jgi:outer membrane protein assembly factor BamB